MSELLLNVEKREQLGTAATQKFRRQGLIPAVLYGHGMPTEHLLVNKSELMSFFRQHGKAVRLQGAIADTAIVNDVQWDPLGIHVLHFDLLRANLSEEVEVTVPVHLHGEAPGTHEGGILIENVREVQVRCSAGSIPESLGLSISSLHAGENATAAELEIPQGVTLVTDPETVLVSVEAPRGAAKQAADEETNGEEEA